jgi:hypothetical protein
MDSLSPELYVFYNNPEMLDSNMTSVFVHRVQILRNRPISTFTVVTTGLLEMWPDNGQSFAACLLHDGFLLSLIFDLEDGGDMFLRNVGRLSPEYKALYPRRLNSRYPPL